jgi:translation initiation factor 1 (eIF-1/SUI1)
MSSRILCQQTRNNAEDLQSHDLGNSLGACPLLEGDMNPTGAPKGIMEVLVQGDQRKAIETALVRRGLKPQMCQQTRNNAEDLQSHDLGNSLGACPLLEGDMNLWWEVLVQGDQRKAIETALVRRGLKPQMIEVVDKTKTAHFF